jgi:hypothetical protein
MPFALLIIGIVLLVSSVNNTSDNLFSLVKDDFTGEDNFTYWVIVMLILGALGYIPTVKNLSRLFMALVIIGLMLSNGGFFAKFNDAITESSSVTAPSNGTTNFGQGLASQAEVDSWINNPSVAASMEGIEQPLVSARPN